MSAPSLQRVPTVPVPHLHRYYGLLRLLLAHPGGLRSPLTTRYRLATTETRRSPTFVGNPCESVPQARDSGGSRAPRIAVLVIQPSVLLTTSASATMADFGAESVRPTPSLSTLHLASHPAQVQDSLPACPLRRWPGWICTSWIPLRGFTCSLRSSSPTLSWRERALALGWLTPFFWRAARA